VQIPERKPGRPIEHDPSRWCEVDMFEAWFGDILDGLVGSR
jgi:hypothetical protein